MKTALTQELYEYAVSIAPNEHELLAKLRQETLDMPGSHMMISRDQGQFIAMLIKLINAKKYLEIGVFTGYSALNVALAMGNEGHTIALDHDPRPLEIAQKYWMKANLQDKIEVIVGDAIISLNKLLSAGHSNNFDLAFIDAKKADYIKYFEACWQLIRVGGIILVDNVFMNGEVIKSELTNNARHINAFNQFIAKCQLNPIYQEKIDYCVLAIADGLTLIRKKG